MPLAAERASTMTPARVGATAVIVDNDDRVLLVKHTYGRRNWDLPGGHTDPGESAVDSVVREVREVREETGLRVRVERLAGIYYETEVDMHHFVFICRRLDRAQAPEPDGVEIAECRYCALDALPRPISDFTIARIHHALSDAPVTAIGTAPTRQWFT